MLEFLGSVWWLIVALGVLVTFHELGHFWVARRLGVRVLRFSVGFGRAIWSRRDRYDTEYAVAWIPLGGYVKMLDEREVEVPDDQKHLAFNRKPVGARIAVVAAGPVFNLIFAVLAFWLMYMVGIQALKPIVGDVDGAAREAGLRSGDEIVAVEGTRTRSWQSATLALVGPALDGERIELTVRRGDLERRLTLDAGALAGGIDEQRVLDDLGLAPKQPALIVGEVSEDSPARAAGVKPGDHLIAAAGEPLDSWRELQELVARHKAEPLSLTVERDGQRRELTVTPRERTVDGETRVLMGVAAAPLPPELRNELVTTLRFGPLSALGEGVAETGRITAATLGMLWRMVTGEASTRNLSGPISIAQYASSSAELGLARFLFFLAVLSLSLAIINLLPIPVLDGGHLLYYVIELVKGSPVSENAQSVGQVIGLMAVFALMALALYNDILRLLPS